MSILEKIKAIYPELTDSDFYPMTGSIELMDESDGFGPFISKWNHPTFAQPTDAELGITRAPAIIEGEVIAEVGA